MLTPAVMAIAFKQVAFFKFINQGFLKLVLFYIVMITGAFPNKSKQKINLNYWFAKFLST
jgi:hypothetical protein